MHNRSFDFGNTLDVTELHTEFLRKGRLCIPRALRTSDAQALSEELSRQTNWGLMVCAGAQMGRQYADADKCLALSNTESQAIVETAYASSGSGGSHLYDSLILTGNETAESLQLARFFQFMNSAFFLEYMRAITGIADIARVSAQATRYRIGHFFGFHSDIDRYGKQRASLVFNLTRDWMAQWGGLLQFKSGDGDVDEAYLPRFNSMSVFFPSIQHAVSYVSPAARQVRYSIAAALLAA